MFSRIPQNTCMTDTPCQFHLVTIEGELLKINLLQYFHNHEKQNQIGIEKYSCILHFYT